MQDNTKGEKPKEEVIFKIGDTVEYSDGHKGIIEKIRLISTGKFVEQCKYNGKRSNIVLTLRDKAGTINLWAKDISIRIVEHKEHIEKQRKGVW